MKKIITISLFCLSSFVALNPAGAQEVVHCISNAPALVAEGTAVETADLDAEAEAERRAIETAEADCEARGVGRAVFLEVDTRSSGVVATSVARYVCSASC
ncbi:MAG: hypothetical protein RIF41_01550 [Polyangiaceae bacterium]